MRDDIYLIFSYNDDITFYIFNAVSALSVHSANNPPFQKKIGQIIKVWPFYTDRLFLLYMLSLVDSTFFVYTLIHFSWATVTNTIFEGFIPMFKVLYPSCRWPEIGEMQVFENFEILIKIEN